ncbi:MAG: sigma-70 family RNA polymerase sigma factor [Bacteroidales bacterium]|nr:sigma-70 family RNA polymerase sigma factor [Bacteroidales bacterium]
MEKTEELKIIEQVKQGDLLSFRLLVDKYKNMAYHIALQVVRNNEDAEEIAQDSFLKAYQSINNFRGESKFSTWFYRIVYNQAVSKTRKRKIETSNIDEVEISDHEIAQAYEEFTLLEKEERSIQLNEAISKLKEDESLLITLFYLDENSIEEISEITNYSVANVKVKLFRARKKLFTILTESNVNRTTEFQKQMNH